jgi:hypothetical protein
MPARSRASPNRDPARNPGAAEDLVNMAPLRLACTSRRRGRVGYPAHRAIDTIISDFINSLQKCSVRSPIRMVIRTARILAGSCCESRAAKIELGSVIDAPFGPALS